MIPFIDPETGDADSRTESDEEAGYGYPAIANTAAVVARLDNGTERPVVAWDARGYALVPVSGGRLFRACADPRFAGLVPGEVKNLYPPGVPDFVPDDL